MYSARCGGAMSSSVSLLARKCSYSCSASSFAPVCCDESERREGAQRVADDVATQLSDRYGAAALAIFQQACDADAYFLEHL
mmetsp:Transcript_75787/g.123058  ORF Transcript_75787/g.123058 Transcript_75787/m.123058 type:complete len:82 (+) Transcript_75787:543-788(+)